MTDHPPELGPPTDVAVPAPPLPDLSLPPGVILCGKGEPTAEVAELIRDFATALEQRAERRCAICGDPDDHNGAAHSDATGDGMGRYGPRLSHGGFPGRPE